MAYLPRSIDRELDELLPLAPAIAIDGPKGVGKTATALRRAGRVWSLDDPSQRSLLDADPRLLTEAATTVLLDEWQRQPSVWDVVRRDVDAGAPPGRYLLTGSATPVAGADTHSGAGRVLSLRMRPMALHERRLETPTVSLAALLTGSSPIGGTTALRVADYLGCVEESGFPALRTAVPRLRRALIDAYLQRVIDRDLPEQGLTVRRPETLRRWLQAYAAASSTTTSYSRLLDLTTAGDGSQPAKTTTIAYRDHLTSLWLLDPVAGWSPRQGATFARLQQAPKHQLADPGLAARLLGLSSEALVGPRGASMAGPLFESLTTLSVRVAAQVSEARVGHLRTGNGDHEVDLIVEGPDGQVVAVEVKLSATVDDHDVRHLRWLREQHAQVVDCVVLTTGSTAYRRRDGIAVVPLALLGE